MFPLKILDGTLGKTGRHLRARKREKERRRRVGVDIDKDIWFGGEKLLTFCYYDKK